MVLCWGLFSLAFELTNMYMNLFIIMMSWVLKLTPKVLNFWKFTSYCSLKPLWSGMGEVVPARTSPTLHPHPLPLCINCRN